MFVDYIFFGCVKPYCQFQSVSVSQSMSLYRCQCSCYVVSVHCGFHILVHLLPSFKRIELYHVAFTTIKRERMLESINSRYQAKGLTVEDIVNQVARFRKLRIPFFVGIFLGIAIQIVYDVLLVYSVNSPAVYIPWAIVFIILFFSTAAGFLIYGRRLARLMPPEISKKVIRVRMHFYSLHDIMFTVFFNQSINADRATHHRFEYRPAFHMAFGSDCHFW